jgi:hypothetical protein
MPYCGEGKVSFLSTCAVAVTWHEPCTIQDVGFRGESRQKRQSYVDIQP